jgi:hypothetical protein
MVKGVIVDMGKRGMTDVSCMVLDSYNHIDQALEKEWDGLVIETKGSIYLTYRWCQIWWEFYGKGKLLRVFFCRSEGKLVGVLPLYIEKIRLGLLQILVARLVGANNPPRVLDLPINKEHAEAIAEHITRYLVDTDRCDLISIGLLSDECEAKAAILGKGKKMTNLLRIVKDIPSGVFAYFSLPSSYDSYLHNLSPNERKNRKRYQNLLHKEHDVHSEVISRPNEIAAEMPLYLSLHEAQWRPQGKLGYYNAWPQSGAFNKRLAFEMARLGSTRLIKITAEKKPIVYEYGFAFGDRSYLQNSARATGEEWDRFSLGVTGVVDFIRYAIEERITRIEAGLSHYDYKIRLGAIESNVSTLRLIARRPNSVLKYYILIIAYKIYFNFYYKLWYSRIQPKLPSPFRRPISITYIRLTF